MRRLLKHALAAFLAVAIAVGAAPLAFADEGPITVVLDGRALEFAKGAEPVLKGGRTYVPFRAIFEGMGAEVGWDNATQTVSAQRDGVTVKFSIGDQTVTISQDGRTRSVQTDAAPLLLGGNTLVPVRFAAQAFGANVGWDAGARTVKIVDVDKLKAEYEDQFTVMDRYLTFAAPSGTQSVNGSVSLDLTLRGGAGDVKAPVDIAFYGLWGDQGGSLNLRFQTDATQLLQALAADKNAVDSGLANLLLSMQDTSFNVIINLETDSLYLQSAALTSENIPADAWVCLSLDKALGLLTNGRLNAAMLRAVAAHDFVAYAAGLAQTVSISSSADDGVSAVRRVFDEQARVYSDRVFVPLNDILQTTADGPDGASMTLALTTAGDQVLSAKSETTLVQADQAIYQQITEQDAQGHTTVQITINASAYEASLKGEITCAPSGETLVLTPAGKVVPQQRALRPAAFPAGIA